MRSLRSFFQKWGETFKFEPGAVHPPKTKTLYFVSDRLRSDTLHSHFYRFSLFQKDTDIDNIICLPGEPGDVLHPFRACSEVVPMSTYEELSLIVSVALLIVAILNYTHKK